MRRIPLLSLTILSLLALAACGGGTTTTASAGPASAAASQPAASAAGGGGCAGSGTGASANVEVEIKDFAFSPDPVEASVGDVIGWTNADSAPHSATLDDGSCDTGSLNQGASGAMTFSEPGTYAYHCAIHPSQMTGTIEVS